MTSSKNPLMAFSFFQIGLLFYQKGLSSRSEILPWLPIHKYIRVPFLPLPQHYAISKFVLFLKICVWLLQGSGRSLKMTLQTRLLVVAASESRQRPCFFKCKPSTFFFFSFLRQSQFFSQMEGERNTIKDYLNILDNERWPRKQIM